MTKQYDIKEPCEGMRYGRLLVLGEGERNKQNIRRWSCRCDCGKIKNLKTFDLINGNVVSCGCYSREKFTLMTTRHGGASGGKRTSEYQAWINAKKRCYYPKNKEFKNYGGRGIKMSSDWLNDYSKFISDMGQKPTSKHSLERIDVDGDYFKENCRWATMSEQNLNKRTNRIVSFDAKSQHLCLWAKEMKIKKSTLGSRIKAGWSYEKILSQPVRKRRSEAFKLFMRGYRKGREAK